MIPQGARLICDYKSSPRYGQSRIAILWSRNIMPPGDVIALQEAALDPSGPVGVSGEVDNHWLEVFGTATLGTLINIGVATTEDPALTYNGIGAVSRDPVDAVTAEGAQRSAGTVTMLRHWPKMRAMRDCCGRSSGRDRMVLNKPERCFSRSRQPSGAPSRDARRACRPGWRRR